MAQLLVRNIENVVKTRLQRRAKQNGRSMEEEVRIILRSAASEEVIQTGGLGTEIVALFRHYGLDSDIPEHRGHAIEAVSFKE